MSDRDEDQSADDVVEAGADAAAGDDADAGFGGVEEDLRPGPGEFKGGELVEREFERATGLRRCRGGARSRGLRRIGPPPWSPRLAASGESMRQTASAGHGGVGGGNESMLARLSGCDMRHPWEVEHQGIRRGNGAVSRVGRQSHSAGQGVGRAETISAAVGQALAQAAAERCRPSPDRRPGRGQGGRQSRG